MTENRLLAAWLRPLARPVRYRGGARTVRLRRRQRRAEQSVRARAGRRRPADGASADRDRLFRRSDDADRHRRRRTVLALSRATPRSCRSPQTVAGQLRSCSSRPPSAADTTVIVTVQDAARTTATRDGHRHAPRRSCPTSSRSLRTATARSAPTASARAAPARRRSSSPPPAAAASRAGRSASTWSSAPTQLQTSNPASPLASTLTVVTDANGTRVSRHRRQRQRAHADRADPRDGRHHRATRSPATS